MRDSPPPESRWRSLISKILLGVAIGLVVTVVGFWLVRLLFGGDELHPRGAIDSPARAATVPAGSIVSGSLREIPDDAHVWLVARRGSRVWAIGPELAHEPSWERRIPAALPRGAALSLGLVMVGEDAATALRSRTARVRALSTGALGDFDELAAVPRFFVELEAEGPRLYAVFPQARASGGEAFRYENGGGSVTAELPDDSSCHRPTRAVGLRLAWRMSGTQSGGWGVAWDRSPAGSFDASSFDRLSLGVKGATGGETFELALKDTAHDEHRVESTALGDLSAHEWRRLSVPLSAFAPVDLGLLENLSIGFSQPDGSGEVCIDEIAFGGTAPAGNGAEAAAPQAEGDARASQVALLRPQRFALEGESARGGGKGDEPR